MAEVSSRGNGFEELQECNEDAMLNEHAQSFMEMLGLKYPIVQAPMDGPATVPLASAVTKAGALGSLPLTWVTPDLAYESVKAVKSNTSGSFFANYVLNFPTDSLDRAIEGGLEIVQFSWGLPDAELIKKLKDHSIKMGIQVVGKENAQMALLIQYTKMNWSPHPPPRIRCLPYA
jgi:NAD(P)H-dependent flavin oxidoreductase YrpB (nitropropane dioxygenase family)